MPQICGKVLGGDLAWWDSKFLYAVITIDNHFADCTDQDIASVCKSLGHKVTGSVLALLDIKSLLLGP